MYAATRTEFAPRHFFRFGNVIEGELEACQRIAQQTGILVDPIYTLAAWELATSLCEEEGRDGAGAKAKVVMLHTGGTLGMFGLAQRYKSVSGHWDSDQTAKYVRDRTFLFAFSLAAVRLRWILQSNTVIWFFDQLYMETSTAWWIISYIRLLRQVVIYNIVNILDRSVNVDVLWTKNMVLASGPDIQFAPPLKAALNLLQNTLFYKIKFPV